MRWAKYVYVIGGLESWVFYLQNQTAMYKLECYPASYV